MARSLEGAETILLSRSQAKLEVAARSVPGTARAIAMDMLDPAAVDRALASTGGIDHLVLTAHAIVLLITNPYVTGHTLVVDGGFLAA